MTTAVAAAFPELKRAETTALEASLARAASWNDAPVVGGRSVERCPLEGTWYRTESVAVGAVRCFVKDFGVYRAPKSRMDERREREITFYRDVFPDGELGLARFAGVVPRAGGPWLVVEHLDAVPLRWCALDVWFEAAAWLGRFHAEIEQRSPLPPVFKDRRREYFDRALTNALSEVDGDARREVERVAATFESAVGSLLDHPQTLVHGAFRPGQVLVDEGPTPPRICPVDWEIAGVGSCLYDLATLTDGFEPAKRDRFFERYVAESPWPDLTAADLADASVASRIHRTLKWIGHARVRGIPPADVRALVASLSPAGART